MFVPSFYTLVYKSVKDVHVCAEVFLYMYGLVVCNESWLCAMTQASCVM